MVDFCRCYLHSQKRIVDELGKPDYIIASSAPPFMWEIGFKTAKKYGAKFIVEFRDIWPLSLVEVQGTSPSHPIVKFFGAMEKRAYKRADAIVATMPYAYKHVCDDMGFPMGSDVEEVFAYTDRMTHPYIEAEDLGVALLKFRNGAYATIEGSVNTYPKNLSDAMAVFGETGTVSLRGKTLDDVEAWNFEQGPQSRDEAVTSFQIENMGEGHAPLYQYVIDVINGNEDDLCPAQESRKALELILAIYRSAAEGKPVKLPLEKGSTLEYSGRF